MLYLIRLAPVVAVVLTVWYINDSAYARGKSAAERECQEVTVPEMQERLRSEYAKLLKTTEEENNAIRRDSSRLRATYERLRKTTQVPTCVPLAAAGYGDARPNVSSDVARGMGVHTEWLDTAFFDAASDIARGESCQRQLKNIYLLNQAL